MIYRFLLLSDEVDDFKREITIDSDASFFDLHSAILDSVGYTKDQMTSFFLCGDDWGKVAEVTLVDMGSSLEEDNYVMESTRLSEALEEEKQKLMYVYEYLTERAFYMELREIIPGKNQEKALCTKSIGDAPVQVTSFEDLDLGSNQTPTLDENFYGDEEYDPDELDESGFEGLDTPGTNPYDDSY